MYDRNVLLISTDYYGYHSKQGTALSRRVKQVADSFLANGWTVTVIHRDNVNETNGAAFTEIQSGRVKRVVVKATRSEFAKYDVSLLRRLNTFYLLLFKGDRSYKWGDEVIRQQPEFNIEKPSLIISFFTPRVSMLLGNYFQRLYKIPWIADMQDEMDYGTTGFGKRLTYHWAGRILKTAAAITTVSPEWAKRDGEYINRKLQVVRHAVPNIATAQVIKESNEFVVFYGGSLKPQQSISVLAKVLNRLGDKNIKLVVAGNSNVHNLFKAVLDDSVNVVYKGWLDEHEYLQSVYSADVLVVIPWSTPGRQVIPSKFYELVATGKPLWVVGKDTGSFQSLFQDWQHQPIALDDVDYQVSALEQAMKGDSSGLFNVESCNGPILTENGLYKSFTDIL